MSWLIASVLAVFGAGSVVATFVGVMLFIRACFEDGDKEGAAMTAMVGVFGISAALGLESLIRTVLEWTV